MSDISHYSTGGSELERGGEGEGEKERGREKREIETC
jgi:hypothetical protein